MNWERKSTKTIIFLILSFIFILLRIDTISYVFKYPFLNLIDPDSYYHLRRITFTINNFPEILTFDPYLSYPYGEFSPWPPFFDFLCALISLPFPDPNRILPFLNLLFLFFAFLIVFLFTGNNIKVAAIACFFISFSGILRIYSSAGRLDHHAFEMLIVTALSVKFVEYYDKNNLLDLTIIILILIISFLTWPGAMIYSVPLIIFTLYKNFTSNNPVHINKGLFVAYHIVAIFLSIYLKLSGTTDNYPYSYKFLSPFQRDFCFVTSIIFFTFYLSNKISFKYGNKKSLYFLIWVANSILVLIVFKNFFSEIFSGLMFIGKKEYVLKTAEEASPLFFSNVYSITQEFQRNIFLFTPFILALPYILWKFYKNHKFDYLFIYTTFFFLLTCFQLRFGFFFMLGYAVILGYILEKYIRNTSPAIVLIIFSIISILSFYNSSKNAHERFTSNEILETLNFIKEKTPHDKNSDQNIPSYGILASWELGHHIIQLSNRPAIAHPFITVAPKNGYMDFINVLFSKNETNVINIMNKRQARFLILENIESSIKIDWDNNKWGENPYLTNNNLNQKVLELYSYNLFYFYGLSNTGKSINEQIRIVFESKNGNVKLFEKVEGTKIILKNKKDYILKAKITNGKKSFFYLNTGRMEKNNQIFIFPYANNTPYPFYATEIYLEKDGKKIILKITEDMVLEGKTIVI